MDVIFTVEGSGYENKSEKSVHVDLGGQVMTGESSQQSPVTTATIKEKFGPIFALKLMDSHFNSTSKRLRRILGLASKQPQARRKKYH